MKKIIAVLLLAAFAAGCAQGPPLTFAVSDVVVSERKIAAEMKSLTVTMAQDDKKTGELPPTIGDDVPVLWQMALTEALNRMAIFQDDADKKVSLAVKITRLEMPAAGFSMTTDAEAKYEIIDRKTGKIIYSQDIDSQGVVPLDYAFAGHIRMKESVNRAVKNNISQFLQSLKMVDIAN